MIDPKRIEFLGLRSWPNVEIVATTVIEQVAVIYLTLKEMEERYRAIEEDGASEGDFVRILLIIDEYRQFYANVNDWWTSIKESKMPAKCPVLQWVGSLLRMAGAAGIHVDLGTQRPDAEFLEGETRDNFSGRSSKGRLSPQGAMMMYDRADVGTTVPLSIRGRGVMISDVDDVAREVQDYYTPDPRKATEPEELQLLQQLRPSQDMLRWPRQRVSFPTEDSLFDGDNPDELRGLQLWETILDACLVDTDPDQPTTEDLPPADDTRTGEQIGSPDLAYGPPHTTGATRLQTGDLLDLDGQWVEVTSTGSSAELGAGPDDDWTGILLTWTDPAGDEGVIETNDEQAFTIRRPIPTDGRREPT